MLHDSLAKLLVLLANDEQDCDQEDFKEADQNDKSEDEEVENVDSVIEKLLTTREICHLKAKENIA